MWLVLVQLVYYPLDKLQKRVVYFAKFLLLNAYYTVGGVHVSRLHEAKALVAGDIER